MEPILSVKDLSVSFQAFAGTVHAVRDVNFDLMKGETLAIVGESGSGKSVTIKAILGILAKNGHIDSGSILYQGEDMAKYKEKDFYKIRGKRISLVFQDPLSALNPIMKIGKQISEALILSGSIEKSKAKQRAIELMEAVGIPNAAERYEAYPFQFSGGMRQRIVIAIALACNPEILICDEPTTALDVTIQARILELINDMKREHDLSVIFITHDLGVVANIADRVCVMPDGSWKWEPVKIFSTIRRIRIPGHCCLQCRICTRKRPYMQFRVLRRICFIRRKGMHLQREINTR